MSLLVTCQFCGVRLRARSGFAGSRGECPGCGRVIVLPSEDQPSATSHSTVSTYKLSDAPQQQDADAIPITEFLDPPGSPTASVPQSSIPIARRMFEALLDPHSIQ